MTTTIVKRGQFASRQLGKSQFNKLLSYTETLPDQTGSGFLRMQWGWGHTGERQWGRSYSYTPVEVAVSGDVIPIIRIYSAGGSLLGIIRTDIARPIVNNIRFTMFRGDCRDFKITLNKIPNFPLLRRSYISITVPGSPFDWYYGRISTAPEEGDDNEDRFEYTGIGLIGDLDKITDDGRTFSALTDIGEAVEEIAYDIIEPETVIGINSTKINTSTGVPFSGDFTIDKSSIKKTLEDFADMTGHDVGVDGDGEFFFLPKSTTANRVMVAGWELHKVNLDVDETTIRNRIVGTRTTELGAGGTGWAIGAIGIDLASQRKWGTIEDIVQAPGEMSDADLQTLVDALVERLKDPAQVARGVTYFIRNSADYIQRGNTNIILPYRSYDVEYDTLDDPTTTFTKVGAGDLAISEDSTNNVDGDVAMLLSWTSAINDYAYTINELKGNIKKMRFYYRPSRSGTFIRVGVGWGLWNEYTNDIPIPAAAVGEMVPFEWDLEAEGIMQINRAGFQVLDADSGYITIDRITFEFDGSRHLLLENVKQVYNIEPYEKRIDLEFGQVTERFSNYVDKIFAQLKEGKISGEIR